MNGKRLDPIPENDAMRQQWIADALRTTYSRVTDAHEKLDRIETALAGFGDACAQHREKFSAQITRIRIWIAGVTGGAAVLFAVLRAVGVL